MNITHATPTALELFAEKNNLEMRINEYGDRERFTASFVGAEIQDGIMLRSEWGEGKTEREAMQDYAKKIHHKILVFNACTPNRVQIQVGAVI